MDRKVVYPSQVPLSADFLSIQRNTLLAVAYASQAWGGTNTIVDGLSCIPTTVPSLAVQILPGSLCALNALDQTAYGSLPVDVTHQVMQQGILLDAISLTVVPPSTAGQAINYLIQAQFQQSDTDATVLAYFNSANPTVPFMGPANSGTAQSTTRKGIVVLQAKAGVAATAGSQVTPAPDAGYVGLYSIVVANGATAINSPQITTLPTAPFLSVKLPQVPSYVQAGTYAYAQDTGTANAMVVTLAPIPASYASLSIFVKKIGSANTGAMTINGNGIGSVSVINADGTALASGQMAANFLAHLVFDGTSFRFMNGVATASVGALTASSGDGIFVNGAAVVALNFPGLAAPTSGTAAPTDLFSLFSQADARHRVLSTTALTSLLTLGLSPSLINVQVFTASGTYTKTAGARRALIFTTAGGGGGGQGASSAGSGAGGGAGATVIHYADLTSVTTIACVVGLGGAVNGGDGGLSSFGTLTLANGGKGGTNAINIGPGGLGGTATTGLIKMGGGAGSSPTAIPPSSYSYYDPSVGHSVMGPTTPGFGVGGNGAPSLWGGAGQGVYSNGVTPGIGGDGQAPGAGGGGGNLNVPGTGGKGANGIIIVFEYA